MADYNSSLPIRTENNGDVVVKLGDGTTPSQQASVDASGRLLARITDTTGNSLSSTGGSLNVNMTNSLSVGTADKTTFTYGTTTFQPVGGAFQDTSPTLTAGQSGVVRLTTNRGFHVNLRDASGNEKLGSSTSANSIPVVIASDQGAVPVSQSGTWNINNVSGTVSLPTGAATAANQTTLGNQTTKINDGTNTAAVKAASTAAVASDPSLVVALSPNSVGKVTIQQAGTAVNNYQTSASLAASASANFDYTVTGGTTFYSQQICASGSGKIKAEVKYETGAATGVYNTFWVGFNSTADSNICFVIPNEKTQVASAKVRVTITNRDNQSQDVYCTISGYEI